MTRAIIVSIHLQFNSKLLLYKKHTMKCKNCKKKKEKPTSHFPQI